MRFCHGVFLVFGMSALFASPLEAKEADGLGHRLCRALAQAVDQSGGEADLPALVVSYSPGPDDDDMPAPLAQSAFTYDNAVAAISLVACGDVRRARRIGDALLAASLHDRTFGDGRLRNAYRAGVSKKEAPALPGWWDVQHKLWAEDAYQDGTSSGNVAWAGLALLTLYQATNDGRYHDGAKGLLTWIVQNTGSRPGTNGYMGGFDGFDPSQTRLLWKSTEHNIDILALAEWLHALDGDAVSADAAVNSRAFLDSMFDASEGLFRLGTTADGSTQPAQHVALDTQLWPSLVMRHPPSDWRRAVTYAETHLAVPGGFDFNEDRDGLWVEGTAQAAVTFSTLGRPEAADRLMSSIARECSPSGLLFATREARVSTGLAVGPASKDQDFFYYRRPHLGATAWGILAALRWNPFQGKTSE